MAAFEHYVLEGSEVRGPWQHMIICAPQAGGIIWWLLSLFTAHLNPLRAYTGANLYPPCCIAWVKCLVVTSVACRKALWLQ